VLHEVGLRDATWPRRREHEQRRCGPRVACRIYWGHGGLGFGKQGGAQPKGSRGRVLSSFIGERGLAVRGTYAKQAQGGCGT
jgi:hypothetical protein